MGKQQVVVVTLLSLFIGCQSQSQQGPRSTEPVVSAPAVTAAPPPESADAVDGRAPSAVVASSEQTEWWCTSIASAQVGFCQDNAQDCESFRQVMLGKAPRFPLPPCAGATAAACFHHATPSGDVGRACFPTLTICNAAREHMGKDVAMQPKDECTMLGTASAAPTQR